MIAVLVAGGIYLYSKNVSTQSKFADTTILDIKELGLKISLPSDLSDMTYSVAKFADLDVVQSVGFYIKHAQLTGDCADAITPFGSLTFFGDKGDELIGEVRGLKIYYVRPIGQCAVDKSLQDELKIASMTAASNGQVPIIDNVTSGKYTKYPDTVALGEYWDVIDGNYLAGASSVYLIPVSGGGKTFLEFKSSQSFFNAAITSDLSVWVSFKKENLIAGKYNLFVVNNDGVSDPHMITILAE